MLIEELLNGDVISFESRPRTALSTGSQFPNLSVGWLLIGDAQFGVCFPPSSSSVRSGRPTCANISSAQQEGIENSISIQAVRFNGRAEQRTVTRSFQDVESVFWFTATVVPIWLGDNRNGVGGRSDLINLSGSYKSPTRNGEFSSSMHWMCR